MYHSKIKRNNTMLKNCNKYFWCLTRPSLFFVFSLIFILYLSVLVSCQSKNQPESNKPIQQAKVVNTCDLISQQDVEQIFNVKIKSVQNKLQNATEDGKSFASQCSYRVDSDHYKSVAIMLRYFANETNPKTFDEFIVKNTPTVEAQNEEQKKILDEVVNSFKAGTKINDLGDSGVWYHYSDIPSLMLYFNNHYHLIINLMGFEYSKENMEACKKIAQRLITTLK